MKKTILFATCTFIIGVCFSQNAFFEPKEFQSAIENKTRTRDGLPGKNYWQNTANYDLKASLDPLTNMLTGEGLIQYRNNSPDSLRYLILKLLPNIHKKGSARDYAAREGSINEGMLIDSVAINGQPWDLQNRRKSIVYGTNLYLIFDPTEKAAPGSLTSIQVEWNYEVPMHGIRNGAYCDSSYFIGYWYPQMAVYDDIFGWDREDYTGKQETYNDTGTYHVELTVPQDYIVWATGDQQNEKEVFTTRILERMNTSRTSGETVTILGDADYEQKNIFTNSHDGTWVFEAKGVPDFAWACSNYYLWDANSLSVKQGKEDIWVNAVYPPGTKAFDKVADVANKSIRYLSETFPGIPYPFNKHITYNGINYIGVEYPMMANNGDHGQEEMYTELTIHEIAHNYIPFYMLSNERKHAWIDEGWVKLIGELYGESLGVKREDKSALNTVDVYTRLAGTSNDLPLIVPSGFMTTSHNFYHSYAKAANANYFLLELMKEKGVDDPLKVFLETWAGKHPSPYDFFYFMNSLCEEDLSWYWEPWYFGFKAPDLQIQECDKEEQVLITNKGGIPLPIKLLVEYKDGETLEINRSIWQWSTRESQVYVQIPDMDNAIKITLGDKSIPDIDEHNNVLELSSKELTSTQ
jgi:hypothetical protein